MNSNGEEKLDESLDANRCKAQNKDGSRCKRGAVTKAGFCHIHDPEEGKEFRKAVGRKNVPKYKSLEIIKEAKKMYEEGHTEREIAEKLNRSHNTVSVWKRKYKWNTRLHDAENMALRQTMKAVEKQSKPIKSTILSAVSATLKIIDDVLNDGGGAIIKTKKKTEDGRYVLSVSELEKLAKAQANILNAITGKYSDEEEEKKIQPIKIVLSGDGKKEEEVKHEVVFDAEIEEGE